MPYFSLGEGMGGGTIRTDVLLTNYTPGDPHYIDRVEEKVHNTQHSLSELILNNFKHNFPSSPL